MKIRLIDFLAGLIFSCLLPAYLSAESLHLSASLDPDQEVPAVTSGAAGEATMSIDPASRDFVLNVNIVGLDPAKLTGAHLHVAPAGINGPVVITLDITLFQGDANLLVGVFSDNLPAENLGDLLSHGMYINVHTEDNPSGEIRSRRKSPKPRAAW